MRDRRMESRLGVEHLVGKPARRGVTHSSCHLAHTVQYLRAVEADQHTGARRDLEAEIGEKRLAALEVVVEIENRSMSRGNAGVVPVLGLAIASRPLHNLGKFGIQLRKAEFAL